MKRKYNLLLIVTPILLTALIILPVSFAQRRSGPLGHERVGSEQRGKSKKEQAGKKSTADKPERQFAPRPRALSQTAPLIPVSVKAAAFAISPAIRDLPPEIKEKTDPELVRDIQKNPKKIIRFETNNPSAISEDPVVQTSAPSLNIPGPLNSFEGQSIFDTIALGQGFLPPDTVGDVGPNHYVQAVNSTYRIWNKAGVPQTPVRTLGSLFTSIPGPCADTNDGDPTVNYDSLADRWLITQFCVGVNGPGVPGHQLVALSQTGDPTGAYYIYDFVLSNDKFNDYPKFGVWPDGYYMSDNQFTAGGFAPFLGAGAFAFDRAKMLAGDPTASFIYFDLEPLDASIGGILPSDADGLIPPAAGAPNVFSYFTADEFGDASDGLRLFDFHADFVTPANSTFTERAESPVAVAAFDPRSPAGNDDIEQPPPANNATQALDAISDRLMNRLQYRNFGTHESLIVNHTVNVGTGTTLATHQAGVRYYELRRSGGAFSVNEQATFAPDANNRWMGSAAMDNQGSLAVGYSVSSTTVFPSVRYAGRLASDPPGGLFQGEGTLIAGGFVQQNTSSRWGDYSQMNVDPVDDCTFWYTQEYYSTDEPGINAEWRTRFGSFRVNAACTAPAQGTLQVNVTNCQTGMPLQGARISIDGNLYGTTLAGGSYSGQLPPGTYSVMASLPNFLASTTATATVTAGGTTVVNVCVTPMPVIMPAGSELVAEDCAPASGAVDPGETVTVNLVLRNTGSLDTTNLVATLLSTGGVTSPSGSQNYGVLPVGGPPVSRPFTFTADPSLSCGGTLTATLQLQDGANDLGTVSFTFTLGALSAPQPAITYSSGNIAVPIPDTPNPGISIPINVGDTGEVSDVNVRVRLNHTFDADLEIRLVHPDGTVVLLSDNRGGSGVNFGTGANDCSGTPTVFDDSAGTAISSGAAPFAGSFRPDGPLAALNGKPANGTWMLRIVDTGVGDVGTVGCVQLEIIRQVRICCPFTGLADIDAAGSALINESCPAFNNAIDPGERATVNFTLRNNGLGSTSNLVATLLEGGGVTAPSSPQSYGVLDPVGANRMASRDFSFTAAGSCGELLTATLQLQDGANNLGTVTYTFALGALVTTTSNFENFDGVVAPALPPGWTTSTTGAPPATPTPTPGPPDPWRTVSAPANFVDTPPNSAATTDNPYVATRTLVSPVVALPDPSGVNAGVQLTFRNFFNTETNFDGGVLEISINGGAFQDVIAAGGSFASGGYTGTLSTGFMNPLPGRRAWTGNSSTFITSTVNLPNSAEGQNVQFRWIFGTDNAVEVSNGGWRIDTISISSSTRVCNTSCSLPRLVVTSTLTRDSTTVVRATYRIQNVGTLPANNVTLTTAQLGGANGTPLPQSLGSIAPGAFSAFTDVFFTNSTPGANSTLRLNGTYTGGTFSSTKRVTIP